MQNMKVKYIASRSTCHDKAADIAAHRQMLGYSVPKLGSMCSTALHDVTHSTKQAAVVIVHLAAHNTAAIRKYD